MFLVKCEGHVFTSCFPIEIPKHLESDKGYIQSLVVERSKDETVYLLHEFSVCGKGYFIECFSLEEVLELFDVSRTCLSVEEVAEIIKGRKNVKKVIPYEEPQKPWFFHPKNKLITEDIFVSS